ncbi:efflux RND transporter periplasmic adaptor subunit [Actinomadura rupiterrae]|uniref:efflux RND transporter periplasmic adaptor subunit n=1 Tax=Actinomadura rupiterrae TaxID=559627 RepID=UPI0020A4EB98|nr:peptidoglycan-binding protein [Actinomadura rupiterrae]MCP2338888.1 peptidoglycan hydrolase-like protein with peptidoglycan-binding domain [Actinomadura rupiterrae]
MDIDQRRQPPANGLSSVSRTRRVLLVGVGAAIAVCVVGIAASSVIKSPQQIAADAGPPKASAITAAVERRVLTDTVVLRGTVSPGKTIEVTPAAGGEGKAVITRRTVKSGQRIKAGTVVAEVSGRPVIALHGAIPAYRDIRPGANGPDVRQIQKALRELGYSVDEAEAIYGPSTQDAVRRLFADRGYSPTLTLPEPDPADLAGGRKGKTPKPSTPRKAPMVKAGEVVFVPEFPARVTEVKAGLGDEVKGSVVTLAAGNLAVRATLSAADRKLVSSGKLVKILSEESGLTLPGRIASIGAFQDGGAEGQGATLPGYPVVVEGGRNLPERLAGQDVRLTIETASTNGKVLVVPSSAVYATADGSTQVMKMGPGDRQQRVAVTTGATGGGFVEVEGDGLSEGDRVVVGEK